MPMNRKLYPQNWDEISRQIKREANWHCEDCDRPCLLPGEDWLDFMIRCDWTVKEAIEQYQKPTRYQIGAAHLNHIPADCRRENLKALCTPCHCRMDLKAMGTKRRLKLERQGQGNLFDLVPLTPAGHGKDASRVQIPLRQAIDG